MAYRLACYLSNTTFSIKFELQTPAREANPADFDKNEGNNPKGRSRRAEVAGPAQRAAKQMRPGHCTNQNPSGVPWGGFSKDRYINGYIACLKLASPAGSTFARGHPVISASMLTS